MGFGNEILDLQDARSTKNIKNNKNRMDNKQMKRYHVSHHNSNLNAYLFCFIPMVIVLNQFELDRFA